MILEEKHQITICLTLKHGLEFKQLAKQPPTSTSNKQLNWHWKVNFERKFKSMPVKSAPCILKLYATTNCQYLEQITQD